MTEQQPITLEVRARPRSGRRAISVDSNGAILINLQSAPESGKANKELIQLVARWLNLPRSNVEVWKGDKSRQKVLRLWGIEAKALDQAVEKIK